ncbi:RNA polymerase sigma factor [uncultured Arcticibacterium sp.]|uniref:RNA polymerase sigma factor n=1 Tax=uncultured Arcticibacterium sp. TaxID=2173042 RepID=UPI0030F8AB8D
MNEKDIILQLQNGQEAAFRHVVELYQDRVYNTVVSITHNTAEAEDICQEVFIEVYKSVAKFRGDSKLSTWIYRIASNKSLEFLRKNKTQKRFAFVKSIFGVDNQMQHQPTDFQHPGILLEDKERASKLFKAIGKLPDNQRVAYTLHNIEGLSYQDICDTMELSKSSVESLLFRAKQNLKKLLEKFYEEEYG